MVWPRVCILHSLFLVVFKAYRAHVLDSFIASTTLSCALHHSPKLFIASKPRVVHCITSLSCSSFLVTPNRFDLEFMYYTPPFNQFLWPLEPTSFRRSKPITLICSLHHNPELFHCIIALSCSLHHNPELFITSQPQAIHYITTSSCSLHPQP